MLKIFDIYYYYLYNKVNYMGDHMEIEERTKDYDKIIQNNKLITRIYNELIRLEQEGLEYNNEYFML